MKLVIITRPGAKRFTLRLFATWSDADLGQRAYRRTFTLTFSCICDDKEQVATRGIGLPDEEHDKEEEEKEKYIEANKHYNKKEYI